MEGGRKIIKGRDSANIDFNRADVKKIEKVYFLISIFEIGIVIALLIYFNFFTKEQNIEQFRVLIVITLVMSGVFIFINVFGLLKNMRLLRNFNRRFNIQNENIDRIHKLNNSLRAQRHDFLNNLQVVYSLIQLEDFEDAREYIEEVYKDIKKVSRVLKTANPAINALLQAKITDAESKGIEVKLSITSRLDGIKKEAWEICRILSNILDNAIFELNKVEQINKEITVEIHEDLENFTFIVRNNGPKIEDEIIEKIFQANFTTKGSKGQGMGLAIIKDITQRFSGELDLKSDDKETKFSITIPIASFNP